MSSAQAGHGGPITALAFGERDGESVVFSGGFDGRVLAWGEALDAPEEVLSGAEPIMHLNVLVDCPKDTCAMPVSVAPTATGFSALAPTGDVEISADQQGRLRWIDREATKEPIGLGNAMGGVLDVQFEERDDDGHLQAVVITRGSQPLFAELDPSTWTGKVHPPLPRPGIAASSIRFVDEQRVLMGSVDGHLGIVDLQQGELTASVLVHEAPITSLAVAADGETAVTGGANGTLTLWSLAAGQLEPLSVLGQFDFPLLAILLDEKRARVIVGHKSGHIEAVALDGQTDIKAPPRPARLFASIEGEGRGAKLYNACRACHSLAADGGNKAGPTFYQLFGRQAGSVPDYPYSASLLESDVIWTEETLSALFEHGPQRYLPGTKMPLQQLPDPNDRRLLVQHIKKLTQASTDTSR